MEFISGYQVHVYTELWLYRRSIVGSLDEFNSVMNY